MEHSKHSLLKQEFNPTLQSSFVKHSTHSNSKQDPRGDSQSLALMQVTQRFVALLQEGVLSEQYVCSVH